MHPALEARGLSKRFGQRSAVDNADLVVRAGTIHGLLGPNGAGKTTLLRMLLGLVRPDSGQVLIANQVVSAHQPPATLGIAGFVESPNFYPYLSARRNLELLADLDGPGASQRVDELIDEVGLHERASTKVRGFSTGMRQRLGLAAALLNDPAVLVVDEPTTGLDPAGIRDLHGLLQKWRADGRAVLLSSHDLDEVERLCDEVTILRSGRVAYSGKITDLQRRTTRRRFRLVTTDDVTAAKRTDEVEVEIEVHETYLEARGDQDQVDRYVIALAAAGIAVRELIRDQLPFESLFFQLTEGPA